MANKNSARKRWRKSIDSHIGAVPGSVTKAWSTLAYRLRGEGYKYDKETDYWYYISEDEERGKAIETYRAERAAAKQLTHESEREAHHERERKRRAHIKLTVITGNVLSNT